MDKIIIRDLVVQGIVGINQAERENPQDIVINLTIFGDFRTAGKSDNIEDCINYHSVASEITELVTTAQRLTIEALASDIAAHCLELSGIQKVRVRIEKPHAVWTAKSAGVEITRTTSDFDSIP